MIKRGREEGDIIEATIDDMAKCLMLLSKVGEVRDYHDHLQNSSSSTVGRLFTCKTCNKQFPSFQALGGHRASHKKPKLMGGDLFKLQTSPPKPKTHECSICGLEFPMGQALGGHMRRHRTTPPDAHDHHQVETLPLLKPMPILKKSSSSKRVFSLDLNLTPLENCDLKLQLGKVTPVA